MSNKVVEINYDSNDKRPSGVKRVTEILNLVNEPSIIQWANGLGFKNISYSKELSKYGVYGQTVHKEIENYLLEDFDFSDKTKKYTMGFLSFLNWYRDRLAEGWTLRPMYLEKGLSTDKFCGTIDAVFLINKDGKDKIVIADWKTSNHIGYRYYMQVSAYKYLLENFNPKIKVDELMIVQVNKHDPKKYRHYILDCVKDKEFIEHLTYTFLLLVEASYSLDKVKGDLSCLTL